MNLAELQETYHYHSGKTSHLVRQLGFAGIALIWVFKTDTAGQRLVPPELIPAAILIVVALTLDLLHYVAGTLIWGIYHKLKDRAGTAENANFDAPRYINWPTLFFFWAKTTVIIVAYAFLIPFLASRLHL